MGILCSEWRKYFHQQSHHRKEGIKTFPKRLHSSKSLVGSKSYPMEPTSLTSLSSSVVVDDRLNECTHIMSVGLLCARATTLAVLRRTDRRSVLGRTDRPCTPKWLATRSGTTATQFGTTATQFQIARKSKGKTRVKSARSGIVLQLVLLRRQFVLHKILRVRMFFMFCNTMQHNSAPQMQ